MQEAEEQDTCRICSAPAEPDQPLFHPCKCSGTIRYIHQDCLTTWLAHSKKKTCDVCKHPYSFTKVYAQDMPSRLPFLLLVRKLAQQAFFACLFVLRAIAVAIIWLAILPWVTVWTWRMYFSMGETTAWYISGMGRPTGADGNHFYHKMVYEPTVPPPTSLLGRVTAHPIWVALSADIFTGQIIASLIVLSFVAVFLLREWISQNARPGVFEDEEVFPDMPPPVNDRLPPPPPPANPHRPRNGLPAELAFRQRNAMRDLEEMRAKAEATARRNGAMKEAHTRQQAVPYQRFPDGHRQKRPEPLHLPQSAGFKRDSYHDSDNGSDLFVEGSSRKSSSVATPPESPTLRVPAIQASPALESTMESSLELKDGMPESSCSSVKARRPPLPTSVFPMSGGGSPFLVSPARTPLESPNLATYRAPEELDGLMDVSDLHEYFSASGSKANDHHHNGSSEEQTNDPSPPSGREDVDNEIFGARRDDDGDSESDFRTGYHYFAEVGDEGQQGELEGEDMEDEDMDGADDENQLLLQEARQAVHALGGDLVVRREENDDEEEEEEEEDALFEDEVAWDNIEAEQVPEGQQQNAEANAAQPANAVQPNDPNVDVQGDAAAMPPELAEELEGNVEDDMEGAMEAIGLRGPIYGVFQNAALMILVLDTAIGLAVWVPYTLGKCLALLLLNPRRILQILHLPIKLIRIVTDPEVDFIIFVVNSFIIRPYTGIFKRLVGNIQLLSGVIVQRAIGGEKTTTFFEWANHTYTEAMQFVNGVSQPVLNEAVKEESDLHRLAGYLGPLEPYFATFGKEVRVVASMVQNTWYQMAVANDTMERLFAVMIGYALIGLLLAVYLNVLTVGNARTASRAVRNAVRQQLLVLKVATFIFIELVLFPLGCGIVLDLCTVWLFPEANIQSRIAFFAQAPLTAMFYHWIAGTMFMYSFAVLLSGCRSIMRPGAMWFIKDPQDQNSHPIRDILDRPTLTQLRKICMSGVMYSIVVACVVGSVAGLLILGNKSILPFRWKNREPLSNVPIDLLFLHFVLPYTMHYFKPKKTLKHFSTILWRFLAKRLRLTSYFFGGRCVEEEYTPKHWFGARPDDPDIKDRRNGSLRRVPATDNLALPRDMRATARVNEWGEPYDKQAEDLMKQQNGEAIKAGREVSHDYTVVYIPPGFKYRIIAFILSMWIIGAIVLGLSVAVPIMLGRGVFRLFMAREVHDGYSLMLGFYLLVACYLCGRAIDRLDKRRQRHSSNVSRADLKMLVFKRGFLWAAKISYMLVTLGIILPTFVALVVDLYIILPVRLALDPTMTPRLRIVDAWALGLLYVKIALHVHRLQPTNRISQGLQQIALRGWLHPDPVKATKDVIVPVGAGLLGMILLPGAAFRTLQYLIPGLNVHDKFVFMHVYPSIFLFAGLSRSSNLLYKKLGSWSQSIRDKEFLVEMRLKNHEPEEEEEERRDVGVP